MADEPTEREQARRRVPLPYSLALRLRDGGVAADMICPHLGDETAELGGVCRIAEAKPTAAQEAKMGPQSPVYDPLP